MKMIVDVRLPLEPFNTMVKNGTAGGSGRSPCDPPEGCGRSSQPCLSSCLRQSQCSLQLCLLRSSRRLYNSFSYLRCSAFSFRSYILGFEPLLILPILLS